MENRTELWANYAKRTQNVIARLVTTRETSLLDEPLVTTGQCFFKTPSTLLLRDDPVTGSSTLIDDGNVAVTSNHADARGTFIDPTRHVAATWLADRLIRMFAPAQPSALVDGARINVPRGKGYRIEIMPPSGSAIRSALRSVTVYLDPVAGAVTQIIVAEAQGDRLRLQLSDHRQNVDAGDIDPVIEQAREKVDD